jgi:glycosyltransferase involved in cell wall biosynthesis
MKILHVFDFFSPHGGGTVSILYKLTKALAQKGHQVTLYTSDFKLNKDYIASLPEVKVYPFHCVSSLGLFYVTPSLVRAARDNLKDFDIVHLHCLRSFQNIVIHHYAKKYKVPYVLEPHGSLPRKAAGEGSLKWLLRWLFDIFFGYRILNDATALVAPNKFGADEHNEFGAEKEKTVIIPLPYPADDFVHLPPPGQFRSRFNINKRHIIMSLGRINYIKGLDRLSCYLVIFRTIVMANAAKMSQMAIIMAIPHLFAGLSWLRFSLAFVRHRSSTGAGIIFKARVIPRGIRIRSSRYPSTGMKSGIRSIGLRA